jgi:flavin-dependent thymidylate synthase
MNNENSVILLGYYGGDKTACLSAWQSTGIEFDYTKNINSRIDVLFSNTVKDKKKTPEELLIMLAEQGHHSPFEKSLIHFQLCTDISTHIQCLKSRIGVSINSESARYKELVDKWYLPSDWEDTVGVQSHCTDGALKWLEELDSYIQYGHDLYHEALKQLTPVLGRNRAKESARLFLPYAKQLDFDMQFNFRSFMHFQTLRNSPHAQKEIREIAEKMLELVRQIPGNPFELSLKAFGY